MNSTCWFFDELAFQVFLALFVNGFLQLDVFLNWCTIPNFKIDAYLTSLHLVQQKNSRQTLRYLLNQTRKCLFCRPIFCKFYLCSHQTSTIKTHAQPLQKIKLCPIRVAMTKNNPRMSWIGSNYHFDCFTANCRRAKMSNKLEMPNPVCILLPFPTCGCVSRAFKI